VNPVGIPDVFDFTGRSPEAAVGAVSVLSLPESSSVVLSPPRFAKAIAAMRRTTTPTMVTRLLEEERGRRGAPP
jgi:hypothetical protein